MSQAERLDRELTAWFAETAAPSTPDYTDALLAVTAGSRQRPRWSFPSRWFRILDTTRRLAAAPRVPWRAIAVLALLLLALVAGVLLVASGRPRVPPPFGLAANGLVAYAKLSDIYVVDPASGARRPVVTGPEDDRDPRWSNDGTRIAFLRGSVFARPAFSRADGSGLVVAQMDPVPDIDSESITWAPDSSAIAFSARGIVYVVEAANGRVTVLPERVADGTMFWKPPDGRQLMYVAHSPAGQRLVLVDVSTGAVEALAVPDEVVEISRAAGWTPDGRAYAFQGGTADSDGGRMFLVDRATGSWTVVVVAYAQLSNDGTRVVGLNGNERETWLCVAAIAGGPCEPIVERYDDAWETFYRWSPDDQWIITVRGDGRSFALDPDGILDAQPAWAAEGVQSWQRLAE